MNEETKKMDSADCKHCDECKSGACCTGCTKGACDHCEDCNKGTCCAMCGDTPSVMPAKKVHKDLNNMVCEAGMCGQQSTWKWYFVIGVLTLLVGLIIGSAAGASKMKRKMLAQRPDDVKAMLDNMVSNVQVQRGDDLNSMYIDMMISTYQANIDMSTAVKSKSKNQQLRDFADGVVVTQSKDLGRLEAWQADWFK